MIKEVHHVPDAEKSFEKHFMEQQTSGKGPKLGFRWLPTHKNVYCVRTACIVAPMVTEEVH